MRARDIALRTILAAFGLAALVLTVPATLHGWHIATKTVTVSYTPGEPDATGMQTQRFGEGCDSSILDGGVPCYSSTEEVPVEYYDRNSNALMYGIGPLIGGIILLAIAFRSRKKNGELPGLRLQTA